MSRLLDMNGKQAAVGSSSGYWLDESDFVCSDERSVKSIKEHGFLRNWPAVYSESKALKSLVGKKGACAGKKVGVAEAPTPQQLALVKGLKFYPMQSIANAHLAAQEKGLSLVTGFAIFDLLDKEAGTAYIAEKYAWNALEDGTWVDFTPRAPNHKEVLLAEAKEPWEKKKGTLTQAQADLANCILKLRFGDAGDESAGPPAKPAEKEKPKAAEAPKKAKEADSPKKEEKSAAKADVKVNDAIAALAKKVRSGDVEAVKELTKKAEESDEMCTQITHAKVAIPLVNQLANPSNAEHAVKLLMYLTDAGVSVKDTTARDAVLDAGGVDPLCSMLQNPKAEVKEMAAAVLGNICHESPDNQDAIASAGAVAPLVDLLGDSGSAATEAAYAIWNLTVGHEDNASNAIKAGAVPKLVTLMQRSSEAAQENASGALMHLAMSAETQAAIAQAGAIPHLAKLIGSGNVPEVRGQAAGALLNLANDSPANAVLIAKEGVFPPLVQLVAEGTELGKEYAAGALMNLTRGNADLATNAAKAGAIPALAELLAKSPGGGEALGALANLASDSADRQVAIYKAAVTRRMVSLLRSEVVDVRREAVALCMNMSPHAKLKERIVEAGAFKPLAKLLKDEDGTVQERAAGALANLLNDHSTNVKKIFAECPDVVPSLVNLLRNGVTKDAKRHSAFAVAMLAAEDEPCPAVRKSGAMEPLLALLKDQVGEAALGIMNIAWSSSESKVQLAEGGAVPALVKMLKSGDSTAKEHAAGALMNLTASAEDIAAKAMGATAPLVSLLSFGTTQAGSWAAGALGNLAMTGKEAQSKIVEHGAVGPLVQLIKKAPAQGKGLAVFTLATLAESQADELRGDLGQIRVELEGVRNDGADDAKERAKALLKLI